MVHRSAVALDRFAESVVEGREKPAVADEGKPLSDEKFGAGRPNGGKLPNGGIDGKPNGRPQGRSIKYDYGRKRRREKKQCV